MVSGFGVESLRGLRVGMNLLMFERNVWALEARVLSVLADPIVD